MEKKEKSYFYRNAEYYLSIIDAMKGKVLTTGDLYEIFERNTLSRGGVVCSSMCKSQLDTLLEIIGLGSLEIVAAPEEVTKWNKEHKSRLRKDNFHYYHLVDETRARDNITKKFDALKRTRANEEIQRSSIKIEAVKQEKAQKVRHLTAKKVEQLKTEQIKVQDETILKKEYSQFSEETASIVKYAAAGLIYLNNGEGVSETTIRVALNSDFGVYLKGSKDVVNILSSDPRFTVSAQNCIDYVGLENTIECWKSIKEECNPIQFKKTFFARINMPVKEVERFFKVPDVEVVTKITETDAVYRITVDYSFSSRFEAAKLLRTFRSTDVIITSDDDWYMKRLYGLIKQIDCAYQGACNKASEIERTC